MSALETRVAMLERRLDAVLAYSPADRNAMPMSPRRGRWYGELTSDLAAGGTCAADLWIYDIPDDEWRAVAPATNKEDVRSFFEVPLPEGMPVQVEFIGNTWVVVDFQRIWQGKAEGTIAKGITPGTVGLWEWDGAAMVDTTMDVTALAWGAAITNGKIVSVWAGRKTWYVAPWEC